MTIVDRLRAIVATLPDGAAVTLPGAALKAWIEAEPAPSQSPAIVTESPVPGWRERLWTCPPETRLGVREVAEALGYAQNAKTRKGGPASEPNAEATKKHARPRVPGSDAVYRAVDAKWSAKRGREPLPCARLDGVLVFTASAVRRWVEASSITVNPEPRHIRLHSKRGA